MELLLALLLLAQVPAASSQEEPDLLAEAQGCAEGSCYPATGNLLVGRAGSLSATSTCGLAGPQEYCIVSHLQDSEKCFICDSRAPWGRESHRIQNIIYLQGPGGQRSWWQSENGVEQVSIRLDLEAEFHFTHLIMKFKTFRPAAMLVERSADFGRTWRVYRYFAYDCARLFPGVPVQPSGRIDEVLCDQRYSEIEPSSQGEVIFKVLDPSIPVEDPYSQDSQDLLRVTNLRVNLSKLHTLGDELLDARRAVLDKYYYAVDELVLRGSCLCYGHAAQCAPAAGGPATTDGMIHGGCQCRHRTAGPNCERCQDFYQDLPWQPAQPSDPHACRACECNGHASRCHFDMAVFLATGNTSGGVCDDCQHNTMGRRCELCKPFYYKDPGRDLRDPSACLPCDCDPVGSLDGGVCDGHTDVALGLIAGQCRCKEHVRGARCDRCKEAFYGLSLNDPQGCQPCRCDPRGIIAGSAPCDHISGDCYCKRFVTGRYCSQCLPEFWGLSYDVAGCRPCACDFGGAYSNRCSAEDGMCPCRPRLMGRLCDTVQPGAFCAPLDHYTYEAEQATGHAPAHPQLPGEVRAEAPGDCLEQYNGLPHGRKGRLRRQRSAWRPRLQWAAPRRGRQLPHKQPDVEAVAREPGGRMLTWTGPGFARVRDGAGLSFLVGDVPLPLEYDLLLRYEPQSTEDWEAVVSVRSQALPSSPRCGNALPSEQLYRQGLPHTQRYVLLSRPFCFEPGNRYVVAVRLQRAGAAHRHPAAFVLVDSLVLLPRVMELPGFHGSEPAAVQRREEMERYTCLEAFRMATMPALPEACARLLCSISALLHDGALRCQCDPQGSTSSVCQPLGGQCPCKPHVAGRRCDRCVPGTYGFGPAGCSPCACSPEGALSRLCDPATGQCRCQPGAVGRRCDQCQPGQWGFPACRPCHCNGHAEDCDPHTGACHQCRDFTAGRHCERWARGQTLTPAGWGGRGRLGAVGAGLAGSWGQWEGCCGGESWFWGALTSAPPLPPAGAWMVTMATQCWAQGSSAGPARAPGIRERGDITAPPATLTSRPATSCACARRATRGCAATAVRRGTLGRWSRRGAPAGPASATTTSTPATPRPATRAPGTASAACTTPTGPAAPSASLATTATPCSVAADAAPVTSRERCPPTAPPAPATATGPRATAPAVPAWWAGTATAAPQTPGTSAGSTAASPAPATLTMPCHAAATCSRGSASASRASGAASVPIARRTTGATQSASAGPATATQPAQRACNATVSAGAAPAARASQGHAVTNATVVLGQLQELLRSLQEQARALQEGGPMPELSNSRLRELEEKLRRVEQLARVGDSPGTAALHQLDALLDSTRRDLDEFWQQLQEVEGRLDRAAGSATGQRGRLDRLSQELQELNSTATRLRGQLGTVVGTGFGESYRSLMAAAQRSRQQQQRAQDAVQGPGSLVGQAQATRRVAERVLREQGDAFRRSAAAQGRALREAQRQAAALSIARISQQICGAPGHQGCDGAPCGGALCRDHMGQRHCGGPGCVGALPVSVRALGQAGNASRELESVAQQLGTVALQLQEAHELARSARTHAQETLGRSQAARTHMEESTAGLQDFIRRIKAFLAEEGADPESIELVARQVLNISLPSSPGRIQHLLQEIRDSLSGLDGVDAILNGTARGLAAARDLLAQARQAQERAEGSRGAVAETQGALAAARAEVAAAGAALQGAREVVRGVENRVKEAERRLQALEGTESQLLSRLRELAQAAGALQEKTEATRQLATQARQGAERATAATGALDQALERATRRYAELRSQVGDRAGASGDALLRATRLAQDARRLLDKASGSQRRLEELERRFEANEAALEAKAGRLRALERRVAGLLEDIRHRAGAYATC